MVLFFAVVIIIILLLGVVLPTLKRKRCTKPVVGRITDQKTVYMRGPSRTMGYMTYMCDGNVFKLRVYVTSKNTHVMDILVNPNKPKEWVRKDKSMYHGVMVLSFALIVCMVVAAVIH